MTAEGNKIADIQKLLSEGSYELGIAWALSELKDTCRHAKAVNATLSLSDGAELQEFLDKKSVMPGPEIVRDADQRCLDG